MGVISIYVLIGIFMLVIFIAAGFYNGLLYSIVIILQAALSMFIYSYMEQWFEFEDSMTSIIIAGVIIGISFKVIESTYRKIMKLFGIEKPHDYSHFK